MSQNIELVQRAYAAFGRGDIEGVLAMLDDNVEWATPGAPEIPMAGRRHGRGGVREFFSVLSQTIDMEHFEPQKFFADGDEVVVLGTDRFRVKGGAKWLEQSWCHTFTVKNGKVVAFNEIMDTAALAAELKAIPASA